MTATRATKAQQITCNNAAQARENRDKLIAKFMKKEVRLSDPSAWVHDPEKGIGIVVHVNPSIYDEYPIHVDWLLGEVPCGWYKPEELEIQL